MKYPTTWKARPRATENRHLRVVPQSDGAVSIEQEVIYERKLDRELTEIDARWDHILTVSEEHVSLCNLVRAQYSIQKEIEERAYRVLYKHEHPEEP